ncbi:MAG: amidoligase family protein [Nitrososphaeria archaeon]
MIQKILMQIFGLNVQNFEIDYFRLKERLKLENLNLVDFGRIKLTSFTPIPLRTYGVELEGLVSREMLKEKLERLGLKAQLTGYNGGRINNYIAIGRDSSLVAEEGYETTEITTPKLIGWGEKGFAVVRKIIEKWNEVGGKTNESCGCHVHVETWHWQKRRYKKLIIYMYLFQDFYWAIAPSRRDNRYCLPWSAWEVKDFLKYGDLPERYRMLNLSDCSWEDGHVEFRLFPGTLDVNQVEAFVLLSIETVELLNRWQKVEEFVRSVIDTDSDNLFEKWLNMLRLGREQEHPVRKRVSKKLADLALPNLALNDLHLEFKNKWNEIKEMLGQELYRYFPNLRQS